MSYLFNHVNADQIPLQIDDEYYFSSEEEEMKMLFVLIDGNLK